MPASPVDSAAPTRVGLAPAPTSPAGGPGGPRPAASGAAPAPAASGAAGRSAALPEDRAELTAPTPRALAALVRDWRAFDLLDLRRREARAELATAGLARDARQAFLAPVRTRAHEVLRALAAGSPLPTLAPSLERTGASDAAVDAVVDAVGGAAAGERASDAPIAAEPGAPHPAPTSAAAAWPHCAPPDVAPTAPSWLSDALDAVCAHTAGDEAGCHAVLARTPASGSSEARLFVALAALRGALGAAPAAVDRAVPATLPPELPPPVLLPAAVGTHVVAALSRQSADKLHAGVLPLLDAHASGLLDGPAAAAVDTLADGWNAAAGIRSRAEREVRRWTAALLALRPAVPHDLFPALRAAVGVAWPPLDEILRSAALPVGVDEWCAALEAAGDLPPERATGADPTSRHAPTARARPDLAALRAAADSALLSLVEAPDAAEAALAERVRRADARLREPALPDGACLEVDGGAMRDDTAAGRGAARDLQPAPFGQWLATIAVAPERVGASRALRRWAAGRARGTVLAAFDLLATQAGAPLATPVTVAGWSGRLEEAAAHDGAAMQATLGALHHELQRRAAREELALQPPAWTPLLGWAALALLAFGAATRGWAVALGAGVCGGAWWMARQALAGRRARQRAVAGAAHARALHQLRAVLEEWSALRRDRLEGRDRLPAARDRLRRTLG